ncbi:hypothetical protein M501DRAFT_371887 [Patellaria atrata CBS 101060]|uniref:Uncharacterized protein n=1 Tax=Patellaria atrata CBS 101060 TaxID=1346257 RepID=A0A9P4SGM6_9PEZI|nr:hypothetical protein M501DRAFT_371887 [Patellaria atrata CBS 101060]
MHHTVNKSCIMGMKRVITPGLGMPYLWYRVPGEAGEIAEHNINHLLESFKSFNIKTQISNFKKLQTKSCSKMHISTSIAVVILSATIVLAAPTTFGKIPVFHNNRIARIP